jgi:hypothetical protein
MLQGFTIKPILERSPEKDSEKKLKYLKTARKPRLMPMLRMSQNFLFTCEAESAIFKPV